MTWQVRRLGEVCEVEYGTRVVQKRDGGTIYPVYGGGGETFRVDDFNRDDQLIVSRFAMSEECVRFVRGKFFLNDSGLTVASKIESLSQTFLDWQILCKSGEIYALGRGTAQKNLDVSAFREMQISYPSLEEQRRIVALLDEAFAGIATDKANAEKNLRNAGEVFQTARLRIFDGLKATRLRLGDITEVQSGGTPVVSKRQYWGGDIPWYSSGELNDLTTSEPERNISTEGLSASNAKLFPCGSLLIGMYDTAALKMSILDREAAFNQAIAGAKPSSELDTTYLLHAISAQREELLGQRRGVRQKNLSLGKIKDILLPLPALADQKQIVADLDALRSEVSHLESLYTSKLAALDELKQSLLQRAFSGAL